MVRHYKKKTRRGEVTPGEMLEAVRKVKKQGHPIRRVAAEYQISNKTLYRYCKRFSQEEIDDPLTVRPRTAVGYTSARRVFSDDQEVELRQRILQAAGTFSAGLKPKDIKSFAYNFCLANSIKCPKSWHERGCAGNDWLTDFLKRHPTLSLRKKEEESFAGPSSFNFANMDFFAMDSQSTDNVKIQNETNSVPTAEEKHQPILEEISDRVGKQQPKSEEPLSFESLITQHQEEEEEMADPEVSSRFSTPCSSSGRSTEAPRSRGDLESLLINFLKSSALFEQPDADRSFFDSLMPSVKQFSEDQKLEFRSKVIELVRSIRGRGANTTRGSIFESYPTAPHPVNF